MGVIYFLAIFYFVDDLLVYPSDHPFLPKFHKDCLLALTAFQLFVNVPIENPYSVFWCLFLTCLLGPGSPIGSLLEVFTIQRHLADLEFCFCAFAICFLFFSISEIFLYLYSPMDQVRSV